MEYAEPKPVGQWVTKLKEVLRELSEEDVEAVVFGGLVEIINSYNEGRSAKQTAERIFFMA